MPQHGTHTHFIRIDLGMQLECWLLSLMFDICIMANWELIKQGIYWPVSHDHIAGSGVELIKVPNMFFEVDRWPGNSFPLDCRLENFGKLFKTSRKFGALLLGLAKSIYYYEWCYILKFSHTFGFSLCLELTSHTSTKPRLTKQTFNKINFHKLLLKVWLQFFQTFWFLISLSCII